MRTFIFALSALTAACTLISSAPANAAARNYDCSKPGNANKAACKAAAKPSKKPMAAKAAAQEPAKPASAAEAPKTAAAKPAQKPAAKQTATTERHYDCSKPGNANKAVCKGAAAVATAAAKPAQKPATKPAVKSAAMPKAAPAAKPAAAAPSAKNNNPAGAIAQCKDGTYSHAKNHRGACSRHGGVSKWIG